MGRSQCPRGLRRRSAAARLLRSWVRIPPGAWMFVCCECCILSSRGLCGELITRPEEFYRLWCVVVCDLETSRMRRSWPALGRSSTGEKKDPNYIWRFSQYRAVDTLRLNYRQKNQSVVYAKTNADCSQIHKNHCHSLCRLNGKILIVW